MAKIALITDVSTEASDYAVLRSMTAFLSSRGYDVLELERGRDAPDLLREVPGSTALLGLHIPVTNLEELNNLLARNGELACAPALLCVGPAMSPEESVIVLRHYQRARLEAVLP